jgi:hypothetical protein
MMKTAQGGLKSTPGLASAKVVPGSLKPAPDSMPVKSKVAADLKPDPIILAMQQMTAAFGNMDQQLKGMKNHSLVDLQTRADDQDFRLERELQARQKELQPRPPSTQAQMNPGGTGPFYAVACGLNGHRGVYNSWSECATWVTGVPGNVFQKFASLQGAREFIDQYNVVQMSRQNQTTTGGNLFWVGPESGSSGPEPTARGVATLGNFLDQRGQREAEVRPDYQFLGPDPSTKKEEELYGQDTTAEGDLVDFFMTPTGTDSGIKKGVCQAATDVVALQGGYLNSMLDITKMGWHSSSEGQLLYLLE